MAKSLFLLSDEAWRALNPHLRRDRLGKPRVDDRAVISGILHVLKTAVDGATFRPFMGRRRRSTIVAIAGFQRRVWQPHRRPCETLHGARLHANCGFGPLHWMLITMVPSPHRPHRAPIGEAGPRTWRAGNGARPHGVVEVGSAAQGTDRRLHLTRRLFLLVYPLHPLLNQTSGQNPVIPLISVIF